MVTHVVSRSLLSIAHVGQDLLAGTNKVLGAAFFGELAITFASLHLFVSHFPLLHSSKSHVLSEQDIETCIDALKRVVSDEYDFVEVFEDHTDLGHVVPSVMAA